MANYPFVGAVSFGGFKAVDLGTPTAGTDGVNKTYADGLQGLMLTAGSVGARPGSPVTGQQIYRTDKGFVEQWDGAAWRVRGTATVGALADITNPYDDQAVILGTDNTIYRYTGSAWAPLALNRYVGSHLPTANISGTGTTEKVGCFVTFNAVQDHPYWATYNADFNCSNANAGATNVLLGTNGGIVKLRAKAGSSGTAVDGTQFHGHDFGGMSNAYNIPQSCMGLWVAPSTAQYTISSTFRAASSQAGNVTQAYDAAAHTPKLIVMDIT